MTPRSGGLATLLLVTLALVGIYATFQTHSTALAQSDSLDPNDCSRGVDEANQESCGGGE